jgi:hypothetical protein
MLHRIEVEYATLYLSLNVSEIYKGTQNFVYKKLSSFFEFTEIKLVVQIAPQEGIRGSVKKFCALYRIKMFITAITTVLY